MQARSLIISVFGLAFIVKRGSWTNHNVQMTTITKSKSVSFSFLLLIFYLQQEIKLEWPNDVPEIRFGAAQNVPTIQEEDIATVFRLVSEKKRPEFYYISFPPTHPMHQCRYFNHYRPAWLRGTGVGDLLADTDLEDEVFGYWCKDQ